MPITRPLHPNEHRKVGDVIADSHASYPSYSYLFPDSQRRGQVLRMLMSGIAQDARIFGAVHVITVEDRLVGAAVWLPPGRFPWSAWRKAKATPTFLPLLWQVRGSITDFLAMGGNAERTAPQEPHWNLQVLGVRQEAQGQGMGRRLMQPVLARADAEGTICYLETADPGNLSFYERFGFVLDREHELIPGGPPHYAMRRPPQPHG